MSFKIKNHHPFLYGLAQSFLTLDATSIGPVLNFTNSDTIVYNKKEHISPARCLHPLLVWFNRGEQV